MASRSLPASPPYVGNPATAEEVQVVDHSGITPVMVAESLSIALHEIWPAACYYLLAVRSGTATMHLHSLGYYPFYDEYLGAKASFAPHLGLKW